MSMMNFIKSEEQSQGFIYTDDQLMARLKFFIGVCLSLTLTGIVFVVLYSLIFVTQPLNAISPIDQKFFELIVPIATFLTGTLSGIMLSGQKKEDQEAFLAAQRQAQSNYESAKSPVTGGGFGGTNNVSFNNSAPRFGSSPIGLGTPTPTSFGPSGFGSTPGTITAPGTGVFGGSPAFGAPAAQPAPQVITGFGGRPAPIPAPQPEI
jgi:hypothetical protein